MKKFRRWLIHKLGGIYKDDFVKLVLNEQEKKTQKIKVEFTTSIEDISKEEVKRVLLDGVNRTLSTYDFEIKKQELNMCDVYSMELEFILQQG